LQILSISLLIIHHITYTTKAVPENRQRRQSSLFTISPTPQMPVLINDSAVRLTAKIKYFNESQKSPLFEISMNTFGLPDYQLVT
jgi:hypothetical protein